MNRSMCMTVAVALFAVGGASAFAADVSTPERSELRERADALLSQRQRDPAWDGGTRRVSDVPLNRNPSDIKPPRRGDVKAPRQGDVKARPKAAKKAKEPIRKRASRAVKSMPGALVRDR